MWDWCSDREGAIVNERVVQWHGVRGRGVYERVNKWYSGREERGMIERVIQRKNDIEVEWYRGRVSD
jgi:hypothetical protein